jgi:hypothetical protein
LKDVFFFISSVLGILAFVMTVSRFIQDNKRLRIEYEVTKHDLPIIIYDDNDNRNNGGFKEVFAVDVNIFNPSYRPISIIEVSHDSNFNFDRFDPEDEWTQQTFPEGKEIKPGGKLPPLRIITTKEPKTIVIEVKTGNYSRYKKVVIPDNLNV